uniref:Pectinesterase n=1 Tax=Kalanchoe fedtschenkoi TaxID=63787 RepID=A0A7N0UUK2_KALFE
MIGKVIVSAVSMCLVVAVVIGLVAGVHRQATAETEQARRISSAMKAVTSFCAPTQYKEECKATLGPVARNASASPNDFIKAAIEAALEEVNKSLNLSISLVDSAKDKTERMAVEDCRDLMQFAVDALEASFATVRDGELRSINDRVDDLRNWIGSVINFQQSCLDQIERPDLKSTLQNGYLNATQLTSNALAIATDFSNILQAMNVRLPAAPSSRQLFSLTETGYPLWMSAADRKLLQADTQPQPNAVVAKDGSGQFNTISDALAAYPTNGTEKYVIYVKTGIYKEYVKVLKTQPNVYIYGDGPRKTIVTGNKNKVDGVPTMDTATFTVLGDGFVGKSVGFRNTAGAAKHQAVAVRVLADKVAFFNCRMDGYQDTLYVHAYRQFYRNCLISGTVDFIFGYARAVIQNSRIVVRRPMDGQSNTVTAQGMADKNEPNGIVIQNCKIVPEMKLEKDRSKIKTYLGRPWKEFSTTVVMESNLGDLIDPSGWLPWSGDLYLDTLTYREYANVGPGAKTERRVQWKGYKVITDKNEAARFTVGSFLYGDQWLNETGGPYTIALYN